VTPLSYARAKGGVRVDRGGGDVDTREVEVWPAIIVGFHYLNPSGPITHCLNTKLACVRHAHCIPTRCISHDGAFYERGVHRSSTPSVDEG
jgi:hypothetical protein